MNSKTMEPLANPLPWLVTARSILLLLLLFCGNILAPVVHAAVSTNPKKAAGENYVTLTESDIGRRNYMVTNGNPMKGLITNPEFYHDPTIVGKIDASMDMYYIPVGKVMRDDPTVVGVERAFDWTYVEDRLAASGAKDRHAVLTFAVHYPGAPLSLPGHLENNDQVPLQ
jgi:hypothetical protein